MLFGVLHCKSTPDEQAKHYFGIIRQKMETEDSTEISQTSMQGNQTFKKLCQLASFGLFEVTKDIEEAETGEIYSDNELKQIQA